MRFLPLCLLVACFGSPAEDTPTGTPEDTGDPVCTEGDVWGDLTCTDGAYSCTDEDETICGDTCSNLRDDEENCGSCGQTCGEGDCERGQRCTDYEQADESRSCDAVCADNDYTCDYVTVWYSHSSYDYDHEVSIACDEVPPARDDSGWSFYALGCYCEKVFE